MNLYDLYQNKSIFAYTIEVLLLCALIIAWNIHLRQIIRKKRKIEIELEQYRNELEKQVLFRTNQYLEAHDELLAANEEMSSTNEELVDTVNRLGRETQLRMNVQTKLEESEELFRNFIEQSTDGVCIVNKLGQIILWNAQMNQITGLEKKDIQERFAWDVIWQLIKDISTQQSAESIKNQILFFVENVTKASNHSKQYTLKNISGEIKHIEFSYFSVSAAKQPFLGIICHDTTERQNITQKINTYQANLEDLLVNQAEKNITLTEKLDHVFDILKEKDAFLRTTIDNIPFEFWATDAEGRYTFLSGKAKELYGNTSGKHLNEVNVEPKVKKEWLKKLEKALGGTATNEEVHYEIQGKERYFLNIIVPIYKDETFIIGTLGMNIDITEQKQAQKKLIASEARFRKIFNNNLDTISVIDFETGRYIDVNERFLNSLGLKKKSVIGRTREEIEIWHSNIDYDAYHKTLKAQKRVRNMEVIWNVKSGPRHFLISSEMYELENQKILLTLSKDIEDKYQMERTLTQVTIQVEEQERRKLAADLHDEVGPLLSSLNMYISILLRKPELQPYALLTDDISRILKEAVASVREISNNISPHVITNYGLNAAITSFLESKKSIIAVNFETNIDSTRFSEVIEVTLYRIVKELFNNTTKYAKASRIDLKIITSGYTLYVEYRDNGVGFNYTEKINQPQKGIGLMSMVNRINNLGGTYSIITNTGKGFHLNITLKI